MKKILVSLVASLTLVSALSLAQECSSGLWCVNSSKADSGLILIVMPNDSKQKMASSKTIATPSSNIVWGQNTKWDDLKTGDYLTAPDKTTYAVTKQSLASGGFSIKLMPATIPENVKTSHWICGPTGACATK